MKSDLAQSKNYRIYNEYEVVFLVRNDKEKIVIGDFYGDPSCAVISTNETWCAIGGAGLIIYFLKEPFEPYRHGYFTDQWIEFGRDVEDQWWIEKLTVKSESHLLLETDPYSEHPGSYIFDIVSPFRVRRV